LKVVFYNRRTEEKMAGVEGSTGFLLSFLYDTFRHIQRYSSPTGRVIGGIDIRRTHGNSSNDSCRKRNK